MERDHDRKERLAMTVYQRRKSSTVDEEIPFMDENGEVQMDFHPLPPDGRDRNPLQTFFWFFMRCMAITFVLSLLVVFCFNSFNNYVKGPKPVDNDKGEFLNDNKEGDCPELSIGMYGYVVQHSEKISTHSALAQQYFDQGLVLEYAYNQIEAQANFQEALKHDSDCAMCHWGLAYSIGPLLNKYNMTEEECRTGYHSSQMAHKKAFKKNSLATKKEKALISAMLKRFSPFPQKDYTPNYEDYATAMAEVYKTFPDDKHITTLYAESLMLLSPWEFWDQRGLYPYSRWNSPNKTTLLPMSLLEEVLDIKDGDVPPIDDQNQQKNYHVLALHLYVHLMESRKPGRGNDRAGKAEFAADALSKLDLASGHLIHMAGHLYLRVGRWKDVVDVNRRAIDVDRNYVKLCRSAYGTSHNTAMMVYGAMASGNLRVASASSTPIDQVSKYIHITNGFWPSPELLVFARFGQWKSLLYLYNQHSFHEVAKWHPYFQAMWFYSMGLAFSAEGHEPLASELLANLTVTVPTIPIDDRLTTVPSLSAREFPIFSNQSFAWPQQQILGEIMLQTLKSRLLLVRAQQAEAKQTEMERAIAEMKKGVALQDNLKYFEPESWYIPLRQCLGEIFLKNNDGIEAEKVFEEALIIHIETGWSLLGLQKALHLQKINSRDQELSKRIKDSWDPSSPLPPTSCFELFL